MDPPYTAEVRRSQAKLYDHEMTDEESHLRLLLLIKKITFPICISHYPCELYDKILGDWRMKDIQGRTRNGMRIERLYMNYPEPTELHDYRYIGNDYREREEYKKSQKNMLRKFARMPELEKNFIVQSLKDNKII